MEPTSPAPETAVGRWAFPGAVGLVALIVGLALGDQFKVGMTTPGPFSFAPLLLFGAIGMSGLLGLIALIAAAFRRPGAARVFAIAAIALIAGTFLGDAISPGYTGPR